VTPLRTSLQVLNDNTVKIDGILAKAKNDILQLLLPPLADAFDALAIKSPGGSDFCFALTVLRNGGRVSRRLWPDDAYLVMGTSPSREDQINIATSDKGPVKWVAYQYDLLAEDWYIVQ